MVSLQLFSHWWYFVSSWHEGQCTITNLTQKVLNSDMWKQQAITCMWSRLTFSFLGFKHQFVVFIEGQQHGFPLGINLTEKMFMLPVKKAKTASTSFLCVIFATVQGFRHTHTHIACGVYHGFTPVHSLPGAGTHRLRPAVVELASHCCLITTSWPERGKRRRSGSFTS